MNFGSSLSKFCLFAFFVLSTISLQGQVVLNELYIRPDGSTATPPNGLIYSGSKEYIELYNKGCSSVDISGYYIGMKTNYGPQGGVIRIPNGTSILPGAHFVIGSAAPGGFVAGNIDLGLGAANAASYCVIGSGIRIINLDGWIALYNSSGTPIDLVYWSGAASNITAAANDFDFNPSMPLCNPASGTPPTALINAKQIFTAYNTSNPSLINYIPTQGPVIAYRTTDGANTWSFVANYTNDAALGATINKSIANGNCNGGTCVTPPLPAAPTVTSPIIYCQGATATPLTATATAGGVLNWWGTNATGGTSSATAPTPSTLTAGTTTYYVSQTVGGCESLRSAIVVTVNASLSPALSCGTNTLNSVVFNWGFVSGATGYNLSYQINSNPIVVVGPITNVNTYPFTGLASNSSVTITLTPTGPAGLCFNSATLSCSTLAPTDCSSCSAPSCPIIGVANYPVRNFSATSCNTWLPSLTNTTIKSFYLVQSDANGFVGLIQQAGGSPALCITRTAVLRPLASSCSVAANVNPSVLNSNGVASGFNPEWYGLTPNTAYVIEVTITLGVGCTLDSLCSNYYGCSIPASPTASVTIQPTCTTPTGTIVVSAPIGASNLYSIDGITYQSSPTFSGLAPNNYIVTVKKTPTGCTSNGTALTINAVPSIAAPTASATVQPSCTTPTGTIVISAPTGANLEYSVNGTTYQTSTSFSGLAPANYNVTVRNTTNGCVSTATAVTINAVPSIATPTASATVQPSCTTPTGTIVISAPTGANLEYSVNGTTYQASTSFSGLAPANYNVTVRNTSNGCVSTATAVTINAVPSIATPTASATVQPSCTTPTGTIVITAPTGANLEYSVNGTTYQASASFSLLAPASYNVTVRNTTNGCVSTATAVTINAVPSIATPTASATGQPSCTTPTGTIVISAPTGANLEYSVNGTTYQTSTSFSLLAPANYNVTVRNTTNGCVSTATAVTINAVPSIATPTASATVQPSCTTPTGTIVISAPTGANLEYSVNGTTYQTSASFSGLAPANYNVTVRNTTNGCVSTATAVTINAVPSIATPTASATVQPSCTTPTGTIVISAPTGANLEYSVNGTTYQTSASFSGLAPANYNVTVRNTTNGCVSTATAVTINAVPSIATPTASATVQPSCTTPTGTIVISAPTGANLEYSVNGTTYQASASFSGLAPANYNVTVRNTANGCVSTATAVTINAVPSIATPTASATVQPSCTTPTGTIVISAPTGANLEYSVNGTTYQASASFSGLAPANYNVTVRNTSNGCVSTATAVTINAVPSIATPTASATVQPSCTTPTGTIVITAPTGANLEYSVNGTTYQTSTSFSLLAPASYNVTVRNTTNGCVSTATAVTINALPPTIIPVFAPISPVCAGSTITLPITSINGITGSWTPNFDPIHTVTYSFTPNTGQCATNTSLVVQVNPLPNPALVSGKICVNASGIATIPYRLNTGLNNSNYTFQWNIDGVLQTTTSNYFDAIVGGNYSVIATDIASSCSSAIVSANVTAISTATNFTATIANSTLSNTNTIIATVSGGSGAYLFALDNFEYQSSPIFANVSPGPHTISILDPDGCAVFNPIDIIAIGYPYFFTPNQDGFNDTWNVIGLEDQDSAKVYIFDRYGKLLKQLSTQGNGWDGTYNNHEMPSTDYWFSLEYNDNGTNKKFGSHFSLKR